jgi:putative colanic acid biosynthesis acetyltransferase WcaF
MEISGYSPIQYTAMSTKIKFLALLWKIVNVTVFRQSPFFCRGWRRALLRLFGAKIDHSASPHRLAIIDYPWNFEMSALASIGPNCWIYALDRISIGDKSCVGEGVKILTGTHSISDRNFSLIKRPVTIKACCWIATAATVLPGVTIGDGAVIGACAVVTKDVEPWTVVAGNPAKFIKNRVILGNLP